MSLDSHYTVWILFHAAAAAAAACSLTLINPSVDTISQSLVQIKKQKTSKKKLKKTGAIKLLKNTFVAEQKTDACRQKKTETQQLCWLRTSFHFFLPQIVKTD